MNRARLRIRPQSYLIAYAVIAVLLLLLHEPLLRTAYYWDEVGQFIPASLDLCQKGEWIAHSTLPNVHPPGVIAYLAGFWKLFGCSVAGTRVAMLLLAALGGLFTFLLAIELGRGTRGAPALTALALLCASPLFFAQAMLAQLDMPAMVCTLIALLFFLQNHFRASALACVVLVLVKETGVVAPALFGCWLLWERKPKQAVWFLLAPLALAGWIAALKLGTGHWFGNRAFTQYNLFYPLHPLRLGFALLRRFYYLFIGTGHFIGTAALVFAVRRMPLFRDRAWRITAAFAALHVLTVSALGGAVLERYLLPALPLVLIAFAIALDALLPRTRRLAAGALLVCLGAASFINPLYPFPFENNLAFVSFADLESDAASAVDSLPGTIATTFPMADALRRPEFGFVSRGRRVIELPGFRPSDLKTVLAAPPDMIIIYDTAWDPLHILDSRLGQWVMRNTYGWEPPMRPDALAEVLSMRVERHWRRHGLEMRLLVRNVPPAPETGSFRQSGMLKN